MLPDNTANITVKYGQFDREHTKVHHLPVIISDNGRPSLTSTNTLAVTVCKCNERGEFTFCEEAAAQAGISIQALVAIFLCILTITGQCPGGWGGDTERAAPEEEEARVPGPVLPPAHSVAPGQDPTLGRSGIWACQLLLPGRLRMGVDEGRVREVV